MITSKIDNKHIKDKLTFDVLVGHLTMCERKKAKDVLIHFSLSVNSFVSCPVPVAISFEYRVRMFPIHVFRVLAVNKKIKIYNVITSLVITYTC